MKVFTIVILLLISFVGNCQYNSVPMKVGDLFGISDSLGNIKIKPKFDVVDVITYEDLYFVGYDLKTNKSSLIYNDKEVLVNTDYRSFIIENELILATKYNILKISNYHSEKNFEEINHLYDQNGKPIVSEDCKFIAIVENADDTKISNEVLLYYQTKIDNKFSLVLYNKKKSKIVKTYIDKSSFFEVNYNGDLDYRNRSHSFIFRDKKGLGKKITLVKESKGITQFTEEDYSISNKEKNEYENPYGYYDIAVPEFETKPKVDTKSDSVISSWRKVKIKRDFYYKSKEKEEVSIRTEKINTDWAYIIKKKRKVGLKLTRKNKLILPIKYDEILISEFVGHSNCYLLKRKNKYGASISGFGNNIIIEPTFKNLFIVHKVHFFGNQSALLKLFNNDGTFYAYAKSDGTIFIKN